MGLTDNDVIVSHNGNKEELTESGTNLNGDHLKEDAHQNGITRFFKSLFGGDRENADRYAHVATGSSILVTVRAGSTGQAEDVVNILDDCGAINVEENDRGGREDSEPETERFGSQATGEKTNQVTIPKVQEHLEVGKRTVESGGVRVRSRIVETPVEEHVQLWEEHVQVNRTPVNRVLSGTDRADFKDQDIEFVEHTEVPVVSKKATVVEEINVSKTTSQRTETIKDTLRDTEVDIENVKPS